MYKKALALSLMLLVFAAQQPIAFAQATTNPATEAWESVKSTPLEAELEVKMKSGETVRGALLSVSDTKLKLSRRNEIAELERENILKIHRLFPKSEDFRRLSTGIGASAGSGVGLAIGVSANRRSTGSGTSALVTSVAGLALGAIGGYLIGSKLKSRRLIYDAGRQ